MRQKLVGMSVLIFLSAAVNSYSQTEYTKKKDVFQAKEIVFYGYDYSGFRMSDAKRIDQDLRKLVFSWIGYCQQNITQSKLESWLDKDKIEFDFDPTTELNKELKSEDLGSVTKHAIPKDSTPYYMTRYKLNQKQGIGFVVIVECFDKYTKTCSGYYIFFDIATRKILMRAHIESRDGNSYNRARDWGGALVIAFKKFLVAYKDEKKTVGK